MAFNPFTSFRKYSKAMFAILAIICMFTFVLSSGIGGGGDFFDQVGSIFGGGSSPVVATIDGEKFRHADIDAIRRKRRLANEYMAEAVRRAESRIIRRAFDTKDFDQVAQSQVQQMVLDRFSGFQQSRQFGVNFPHQAIYRYLPTLRSMIERAEADKKPAAADTLRGLERLFRHDLQRMARRDGELYFGGTLRTGEGIIDFLAWTWVADQRDIRLTDEVVRALIDQETMGELTSEEAAEIEKLIFRNSPQQPELLLEAFHDEFRVWIAQTALLGQSSFRDNVPAYLTPHELRQEYNDKRMAVRVSLLPVEVDKHLAKVTDTPTDLDLEALFQKYKNAEWNPSTETPGFKEPKRAKIEFLAGRADQEAFRKGAQEQAQKDTLATAAMLFGIPWAPATSGMATAGGIWNALHKVPDLPEMRLKSEYERYTANEKFMPWYRDEFFGTFRLHSTSVVHPHIFASTIATAAGAWGVAGSPLQPMADFVGQVAAQEFRERIRIGMSGMAGVGPNLWALGGLPDAVIPQPLPLNVMRGYLIKEVNDDLTRAFFTDVLRKLQEHMQKKNKEVNDAKKPETKKELQNHITEFIKKYNLKHGRSTELRDRYSMISDPGLKTLSDLYFEERRKTDPKGYDFAEVFFFDRRTSEADLYRPVWFESKQLFFSGGPSQFGELDKEHFLVWKTEETAAKTRTYKEAKADVEAAWKRSKARDIAKTTAEEAAKQLQTRLKEKNLRDQAAIEAELKDFAAEKKFSVLNLDPLAGFVLEPGVNPLAGPQYRRGSVSMETVPNQTLDFAAKLHDMRKLQPGETQVLHDAGKSNFFVAVLLGAEPPSDFDFRQAFSRISPPNNVSDDLLLMVHQFEHRGKLLAELTKQIRSDAKAKVVEEELKKYDDTRSGEGE